MSPWEEKCIVVENTQCRIALVSNRFKFEHLRNISPQCTINMTIWHGMFISSKVIEKCVHVDMLKILNCPRGPHWISQICHVIYAYIYDNLVILGTYDSSWTIHPFFTLFQLV